MKINEENIYSFEYQLSNNLNQEIKWFFMLF